MKKRTKKSDSAPLKRLADARVTRAIRAISLVGNLSSYHPTDTQISQILASLATAFDECGNRLRGKKGFELK